MRLAWCLVLAGCWRDVPVESAPPAPTFAEPEPSPVPVHRATATPYREVAGTWTGIGYQYDTKTQWPIEMTLFARGNIGDVIGMISYPSLSCTGDLIRQPERGSTLAMTERLTAGQGRCVDGGTIRIPQRAIGHEIEWRWDFSNGTEGASSTLRRD